MPNLSCSPHATGSLQFQVRETVRTSVNVQSNTPIKTVTAVVTYTCTHARKLNQAHTCVSSAGGIDPHTQTVPVCVHAIPRDVLDAALPVPPQRAHTRSRAARPRWCSRQSKDGIGITIVPRLRRILMFTVPLPSCACASVAVASRIQAKSPTWLVAS